MMEKYEKKIRDTISFLENRDESLTLKELKNYLKSKELYYLFEDGFKLYIEQYPDEVDDVRNSTLVEYLCELLNDELKE